MKHVFITLVAPLTVLTGCGGNSSPGSGDIFDDSSEPLTGSACDNDYYRSVTGTYSGTVDYLESIVEGATGTACSYSIEMYIAGRDDGIGHCVLTADVQSSVEQSVVLESSDPVASQCIDGSYLVDFDDPLAQVEDPFEGQGYSLPIDYTFTGRFDAPSSGPYFGDDSVNVRYVNLFGALVPEVNFISVGDGFLTFERRNPSAARMINGELVKE